ncbi:MAG: hypothetical protein Q9227_000392 [Pyrenula ochraceoflavens]
MKFSYGCQILLTSLPYCLAAPYSTTQDGPDYTPFSSRLIFQSPPNYTVPGVLYARTTLLTDNTILATWENYSPEPPPVYFPIYHSTDGAQTWTEISRVQDTANNLGNRYQPFLYTLPQDFAGLPAGTVLLAGNSIPTDLNTTHIDLYYSPDSGVTWTFLSEVASGGVALPDNGQTPIWEPFLQLYNDQLIVFYSDQRDPAHGQKLVHQTSSDLLNWDAPVDDVAYPTYTDRPGMTTVTQLPNQQWMMTYEYGGGPTINNSSNYSFPVYYRLSDSPLTFNSAEGLPLITTDGFQPTSSPYLTWSSVGNAENGTIAVSCGTSSDIFVNQALAAEDAWVRVSTPEKVSYTRHLRVLPGEEMLLIIGGGPLPPSANNSVTDSVIDLGAAVADLS